MGFPRVRFAVDARFRYALVALLFTALAGGLALRHETTPVQPIAPPIDAALPNPAHLIWPGGFSAAPTDGRAFPFLSAGLRYKAAVSSDGFVVQSRRAEHAVAVSFAGAEPVAGEASEPERSSPLRLFRAGAEAGQGQALPRYGQILFREAYPGIHARYRHVNGDMELDFIVEPGASPQTIRLVPAQEVVVRPLEDGGIVLSNAASHFRLKAPYAYQGSGESSRSVPVEMVFEQGGIEFRVGPYDATRTLVIDPLVTEYSTLIGAKYDALYDNISAIRAGDDGSLYLGGRTQFDLVFSDEYGFPTTTDSLRPPNPRALQPGNDCVNGCGFILKLNPARAVVYGALIYRAQVNAIDVTPDGKVVATGRTLAGSEYPRTPGTFSDSDAGGAFAFKLSADGREFIYSTLFAASEGLGVAVDEQGHAYVVGLADAPGLPTTPGSVKPQYESRPGDLINEDGFVLKVDSTGSTLLYGTYLGGELADTVNGVVVDAQGRATVAGRSTSQTIEGIGGRRQEGDDAFVARLSSEGSIIEAGRFIGGTGTDSATAIARSANGGFIVGGDTFSSDLPTTSGALQRVLHGERNGWVARLDSELAIAYLTYYGGSFTDGVLAVAGGPADTACIVGVTFSADLATTPDAFQDVTSAVATDYLAGLDPKTFYVLSIDPVREAYFAQLSADGQRLDYATYLGGYDTRFVPTQPLTYGGAVACTPDGRAYAAGRTDQATFPQTGDGLKPGLFSGADAFLVAFEPGAMSIPASTLLPPATVGVPYRQALVAQGGVAPYRWEVVSNSLPNGFTLSTDGTIAGTALNETLEASAFPFTVRATDALGARSYKKLIIKINYDRSPQCSDRTCSLNLPVSSMFAFYIPILARGVAPYSLTVVGDLPPGTQIVAPDAQWTGAVTTPGNYRFGMRIQDATGRSATLNWDVTVTGSTPGGPPGGGGGSPGGGGGSPGGGGSGGGGGALSLPALLGLISLALALAALGSGNGRRRQGHAANARASSNFGLRQDLGSAPDVRR